MKDVSLIALTGPNGEIGNTSGARPAFGNFQESIDWFMNTVGDGIVVVGRKTVDRMVSDGVDLSGLPYNLAIFTRKGTPKTVQGYIRMLREEIGDRSVFIAGGKQTYEAFLPFCSNLFIRRTSIVGVNDVFLPPLFSPKGTVH
jgi:dihydrofolate reductase